MVKQYYLVAQSIQKQIDYQIKKFNRMSNSYRDMDDNTKAEIHSKLCSSFESLKEAEEIFRNFTNDIYED